MVAPGPRAPRHPSFTLEFGRTLSGWTRGRFDRGKQPLGPRRSIESLDVDALRKRKKTVNTVLSILRVALRRAWENGKIDSERPWRCIRRFPNVDAPRVLHLRELPSKWSRTGSTLCRYACRRLEVVRHGASLLAADRPGEIGDGSPARAPKIKSTP